jgi:CubicO group peptidase (beta-lactamase class C family)
MRAGAAALLATTVMSSSVFSPMLRAKSGRVSTKTTISRLEGEAPDLMKKGTVPGLAIAMIRGGKTTWVHGFGTKEAKKLRQTSP